MMGGPANGLRPRSVGPMGELTDVASAKRAVRGVLMERLEAALEARGRMEASGSFFSSAALDMAGGGWAVGGLGAGQRGGGRKNKLHGADEESGLIEVRTARESGLLMEQEEERV